MKKEPREKGAKRKRRNTGICKIAEDKETIEGVTYESGGF